MLWQRERWFDGDHSIELSATEDEIERALTPFGKCWIDWAPSDDLQISLVHSQIRARRLGVVILYELLHEGIPIPADHAEFDVRWPRPLREKGRFDSELVPIQA
jgi:hypothetical protein